MVSNVFYFCPTIYELFNSVSHLDFLTLTRSFCNESQRTPSSGEVIWTVEKYQFVSDTFMYRIIKFCTVMESNVVHANLGSHENFTLLQWFTKY